MSGFERANDAKRLRREAPSPGSAKGRSRMDVETSWIIHGTRTSPQRHASVARRKAGEMWWCSQIATNDVCADRRRGAREQSGGLVAGRPFSKDQSSRGELPRGGQTRQKTRNRGGVRFVDALRLGGGNAERLGRWRAAGVAELEGGGAVRVALNKRLPLSVPTWAPRPGAFRRSRATLARPWFGVCHGGARPDILVHKSTLLGMD